MRKITVYFVGFIAILSAITACTFTKLNVKEENVMAEYDEDISETTEDSFTNDKELHSKVDEVDTSQKNEMSMQTTDSEKNEITTESKNEKVECDVTVSEKPTTSIPTTSNPTTNSSSNTGSGFEDEELTNRKLCECLAWGYLTAEGVVDGWMNSSAHKDILMDSNYVKLAVVRIGNKWVAVNSR